MAIPKIRPKVNAAAIAAGLLKMIPELGENYEVALKFGMLPAPLMELLEKQTTEKLRAEYGAFVFDNCNGKKVVAKIVKDVSHEMYAQAEMVV